MESQNEKIFTCIARFLEGVAEKEEEQFIQNWIREDEANRREFEQMKNIWMNTDPSLHSMQVDTENALDKVLSQIHDSRPVPGWWNVWRKVAAILLLPLLAANIYFFFNGKWFYTPEPEPEPIPVFNELYASFGMRSSAVLNDGTHVWLNTGSTLRYPDKFLGDKREVYLSGLAYFEVESDKEHPFVVHTSDLSVTATGTKFTVLNYTNEGDAAVGLVSGKVMVNKSRYGEPCDQIAALKPNQMLMYDKASEKTSITVEDPYKYYCWKDGIIVFRNDPLSEVVKTLGRTFNVDIELQGESLQNFRYRATFQDETFNEILKLLTLSSPVKYREVPRKPLPDGTFPRRKIIIYAADEK